MKQRRKQVYIQKHEATKKGGIEKIGSDEERRNWKNKFVHARSLCIIHGPQALGAL